MGQADREGGREEKNGRWRKTEGKRKRSVNSNQHSRDLRIECERTHARVCVHTCARVSASPPSFTFTKGAADQTALNKRKPFPSLLRSQRTCVRAVEWLSVHAAEDRGDGGGRRRRGGGGWGQAGGGSHYPPCQLWMEPTEDYGTFCKATMGATRIRTHFHPLRFFPPSNKRSFVHAAGLAIYQADTWSPSPKEPPPLLHKK